MHTGGEAATASEVDADGEFGPVLRSARRRAGLTQEALAEAAGLGLRTVQELERGGARPRRATLRRLADALGLPVEPWFPFTTPGPRRPRSAMRGPGERPGSSVPVPRTALVGRRREVADGLARLEAGRLVTLVGPGGVGKSRLTVELAGRARTEPTWWVELGDGDVSPLVPLATSLGARSRPGESLLDAVAGGLRDVDGLVVFDGCEHCVDGCVEVADRLLDACPGLRLLCTSRVPLRMYGEAVLRVAPLDVPAAPEPDSVRASEAGRLFLERLALVRPEIELTEETARLVTEICTRLDGLPLSIELAAAAAGTLSLDQLAERVRSGEALSLEGWRDSPPRHGTLRQVLAWSHGLLDVDEQAVFRRLGVFAGSFTADAAEEVCADSGDIGSERVLPLLSDLVEKSLVAAPEADRFRLLDTVRDYALELLRESGEEGSIRQRHLACYAAQSARAFDLLQGPEQQRWLERLDADIANVWAAVRWSAAEPRPGEPGRWERVTLGQPLLSRIWRYWFLRGSCVEAYTWLRRLLDEMGPPPATEAVLLARAFGLGSACVMAWHLGDANEALRLGDESLALRQRFGDEAGAGNVVLALGMIRCARGEYRAAQTLLERSLADGRRLGDAQMAAFSSLHLGRTLTALGDRAGAERAYGDALATFERTGDAWASASALHGWGVLRRGDDLAGAVRLLERSVQLFRDHGDRGWSAQALADLGRARHLQGDLAAARALLRESEELASDAGYGAGRSERSRFLALILWEEGERERAVAYWRDGLEECLADPQLALAADHLTTAACWHAAEPDAGAIAPQLVELLAAAASLRTVTHSLSPREERDARKRAFATAKSLAGPQAARDAWRRGRRAGLHEAATLARGLLR